MNSKAKQPMDNLKRALLIIDVQNDFCENGPIPSIDGSRIASLITQFIELNYSNYELILASKDWHKSPIGHFSKKPDFTSSWPNHCLASTKGAELHPSLNPKMIDHELVKGEYSSGLSAFQAKTSLDETLLDLLDRREIDMVDICGLSAESNLYASAIDSLEYGFPTTVFIDICSGTSEQTILTSLEDLESRGVNLDYAYIPPT